MMNTLEKAKRCLEIINERKAVNPVLIDVGDLTSVTDFFLIASGQSSRQVQSISRHLRSRMKQEGFRPISVEGESEAHWILIDYGDVIVHLFYQPTREFYDLEGLWFEADRVDIEEK
jgi:ribosome-associated protein